MSGLLLVQIQLSELRKKCEPANMGTGQIHMETKSPAFRYKLRTLLILLTVGPPMLWGLWLIRFVSIPFIICWLGLEAALLLGGAYSRDNR